MKFFKEGKTSSYQTLLLLLLSCVFVFSGLEICHGQFDDYDDAAAPPPPPKGLDTCNGIFLTYSLNSREKEWPHVKDVKKQAWAFKAEASLTNVGDEELKGWQMYIGFQHKEVLVSADGAVPVDSEDFPAEVGNGTTIAGSSMMDLKTAISTANDWNQIAVRIQMSGTQFGLGKSGKPMPKTIKLVNDGFKCPNPMRQGILYLLSLHACMHACMSHFMFIYIIFTSIMLVNDDVSYVFGGR